MTSIAEIKKAMAEYGSDDTNDSAAAMITILNRHPEYIRTLLDERDLFIKTLQGMRMYFKTTGAEIVFQAFCEETRKEIEEKATEEAEELLSCDWGLSKASSVRVDNERRECSTLEAITYGVVFLLAVIVGLLWIVVEHQN